MNIISAIHRWLINRISFQVIVRCLQLILKGQSAGVHFIANLHITETRSILFLTKYGKNNITGWAKAHSKAGFQETIDNQAKYCKDWSGFLDVLWFQVELHFFQSEKTSVQVSAVPNLTVSLKALFFQFWLFCVPCFSEGYCSSPLHLTPCSRTDQSNTSPQIYPEKGR